MHIGNVILWPYQSSSYYFIYYLIYPEAMSAQGCFPMHIEGAIKNAENAKTIPTPVNPQSETLIKAQWVGQAKALLSL